MTTALERYSKLEAEAIWRPGPDETGREVILGFGTRTLTIIALNGEAIGHWPLASLREITGAEGGDDLLLAPDRQSAERLRLADPLMIDAIRTVVADLGEIDEPEQPRRGRRGPILFTLIAGVLVAGGLWLSNQRLVDWISRENEVALGGQMIEALPGVLTRNVGQVPERCVAAEGRAALDRLIRRVVPRDGNQPAPRLVVLRHPTPLFVSLPGGHSYLSDTLLEAARTPEHAAALIADAAGHHAGRHPISRTLKLAGPIQRLRITMTGEAEADEVDRLIRALIDTAHSDVAEAAARDRAEELLAKAGLPLNALDDFANGASDALLVFRRNHPASGRARPSPAPAAFEPALSDRDWIALQNICDRSVLP